MSDEDPKKTDPWVTIGRYSGLAMMLPAATVTGYIVGYYLDRSFGTHYLKVVFLILGTIGGFIQLIRGLTKE